MQVLKIKDKLFILANPGNRERLPLNLSTQLTGFQSVKSGALLSDTSFSKHYWSLMLSVSVSVIWLPV